MGKGGAFGRVVGMFFGATSNEIASFLTLSLILQAQLATRYVQPIFQSYEAPDTYCLMGALFVMSYYVVPVIVSMMTCCSSGAALSLIPQGPETYSNRLRRLPLDFSQRLTMLLMAVFLATVTKVPAAVRFELSSAFAIATVGAFFCRLLNASILDAYFHSISRLSAVVLVGYAVVPGFNASFSEMVRYSAGLALHQVERVSEVLLRYT